MVVPVVDESDDALVDRLRAMAAVADPIPSHVEEAARAALSTRSLDTLARLLADSHDGDAVLTRGEPGPVRLLSFGADDLVLELQVTVERGSATVRGLVRGTPGPVTVELHPGGSVTVDVDEGGYFTASGLPATAVRARVRAGSTTTEWFVL